VPALHAIPELSFAFHFGVIAKRYLWVVNSQIPTSARRNLVFQTASTEKGLPGMTSAVFLLCFIAAPRLAAASPTAVEQPYTLSIFAQSTDKYSQPDSIVRWRDHILVDFQNHVAKDGSDSKSSTIVQYSLSVPDHNDGRHVVGEDDLGVSSERRCQSDLVVIELESGHQKQFSFAPTVHGGGYDDIRVKDGKVLMTASNPNLNGAGVNTFPALVVATLHGSMADVEPILSGDAQAKDIPTGASVTLNLTDPDSLSIDPRGNVVLDSQADAELDKVYRLDSSTFGFEPGTAYSTSDTAGIVAVLNLDNGVLTPIATGFVSTRGMIFVALGEGEKTEESSSTPCARLRPSR
jgi:hypothetical protein